MSIHYLFAFKCVRSQICGLALQRHQNSHELGRILSLDCDNLLHLVSKVNIRLLGCNDDFVFASCLKARKFEDVRY